MAPAQKFDTGNTMLGIGLKLVSVVVFVSMATMIKLAPDVPAGQLVFFRSFFGLVPVVVMLGLRGTLWQSFRTERPFAHIRRGVSGTITMALLFIALIYLPLPEATTLGYAAPLLLVVLSALVLKETVRIYRWSAVALGLVGVCIVAWPNLTLLQGGSAGTGELIGLGAALAGALGVAITMLAVRDLVRTEPSGTIVIYFSALSSLLALLSLPLGWIMPDPVTLVKLIGIGIAGGIGQVLVTECYRHADVSVIAPLDYSSLIWAVAFGYLIFGDQPSWFTLIGGLIVIAAGVMIIWRERQLGLERQKARRASTPHG